MANAIADILSNPQKGLEMGPKGLQRALIRTFSTEQLLILMHDFMRRNLKIPMKRIAEGVSIVMVLPLFMIYQFAKFLRAGYSTFQGLTQFLSLFPGGIGSYLRKSFLHLVNPSSSLDCEISFGTIFSHPDFMIGKGVYIGPYCSIGRVVLADDVLISSHVSILSGKAQHRFDDLSRPIRQQDGKFEKVIIGEDVWIGSGAVIAANVGKKCIVGAGSVVVKELEAWGIYVGNPARLVRKRNEEAPDLKT